MYVKMYVCMFLYVTVS